MPSIAEVWKPVTGWQDVYEVSSRGRLRRLKASPGTRAGRIVKASQNHGEYVTAVLRDSGRHTTRYVHQLVAEAFCGPRPTRQHEVRHLNGLKDDNRACNLAWGTRKENMADSQRLGQTAVGSRVGSSKLTEAQVRKIKQLLREGWCPACVARRFFVQPNIIVCIRRNKTWKHVNA